MMKKFFKVFLAIFILCAMSIHQIYAVSVLKPKKLITLPIEAFHSNLAVHKGTLYYMIYEKRGIYSENSPTFFAKDIMSSKKAVKILEAVDYQPSFHLLSDGNLYITTHYGGGFMGGNLAVLLNKTDIIDNKKDDQIYLVGYGSYDVDIENKKFYGFPDPYFMGESEGKEHFYEFYSDVMHHPNVNFSAVKKDVVYCIKCPYSKNVEDESQYGIVAIDRKTGKDTVLIPGIYNMTMGENQIYYWKQDENDKTANLLYSYSLKDGKTTLICNHKDPDFNIIPIGGKVFFMGNEEYTPKKEGEYFKKYTTLYMAENGKCTPLYSNMEWFVTDGKNMAVLFQGKNKSEIKLINKDGIEFANLTVPVSQANLFISGKDLIVWSWQDKSVRYYEVPNVK